MAWRTRCGGVGGTLKAGQGNRSFEFQDPGLKLLFHQNLRPQPEAASGQYYNQRGSRKPGDKPGSRRV
jgi:hypothetical protein